jgi:hypothetical protein
MALLIAPVTARGDGSAEFNGDEDPNGGTSKLQNDTADVLNGSQRVTLCCWIYPESRGENNNGYVFVLDEQDGAGTAAFVVSHHTGSDALLISKKPGSTGSTGFWTIPINDGEWNAVCVRLDFGTGSAPTARVNYSSVSVTTVSGGSDIQDVPAAGYCVGNRHAADKTWDGRIAHVQAFNEILSDGEADSTLLTPGSVANGLRLWLPIMNETDVYDRSGNGFDGTPTDLDTGANRPPIDQRHDLPPGIAMVPSGTTTITQHVLPRYSDGTSYPSGQLLGHGPPSVLRANLSTGSMAAGRNAIVITEDYEHPNNIDYFQAGAFATISGDINSAAGSGGVITVTTDGNHGRITGESVSISGSTFNTFSLDDVDGNGGMYTANSGIWESENSWPDREHGALVKSSGVAVEGVTFFYIPGTCLVVGAGNGPENRNGSFRPFDSEKARIWNCQFHRAYRGIEFSMVDALVGRLNGFGLRDYGIKFTAGSAQIDGALHFYGVGIGGIDQPAVWFGPDAGGCWGGPIYAENSPVGMRVEGSGNKLTGFYSKNCFLRNLWITGERNSIENFELDEIPDGITQTSGGEAVLIGASGNTLSNGTIGGLEVVPAGEIAVRVKDGNAGERLVINNVSFQGTEGSSAPLISIEDTLRYARLDVIAWCPATVTSQETFVDLYTGDPNRLGPGNVIFITAQNYHTPVKLPPSGWDEDSNLIVANGVRVLGSITGATNATAGNPIEITSAGHELRDGEKVTIAAVQGNTAANGSYFVDVLSANTFALYTNDALTTPQSGNGAYTADMGYFGKRFNSVDVAAN